MLLLGGSIDEAFDALALCGRDQRPDLVLLVVEQVIFDALHRRRQVGHEIVIDLLGDIHAARRGAVLPGIVVAESLDALDDGGHVGVIEDDHGRLAAKLQVCVVSPPVRRLDDLLPGRDAARHRHSSRPSGG